MAIIPKYRRKVLYGQFRAQVGALLRELCRQRGIEPLEGHSMPDHIHMCLSIRPKFSVAHTLGFLKGKSAVRVQRELLHERRMTGLSFWASADPRPLPNPRQGDGAQPHGPLETAGFGGQHSR